MCYSSPERFYHNSNHINDGLIDLYAARHLLREPVEAEIGWFFHDYDYDTRAKNNEEKSAESFSNLGRRSGISQLRINRVNCLILPTKHFTEPPEGDAQIIVDVDLSILGKPEEVFDEYERNIRKEYLWVEEGLFRRERKKILEVFLKRSSIYLTDFFRERYEGRAVENLERSIKRLSD